MSPSVASSTNQHCLVHEQGRIGTYLKYDIVVEKWRTIAYVFFWCMSIFAIILANVFVAPALKAGPAVEGDTCGPFNRETSNVGVELGKGFDLATQSHLVDIFGYNNICANWDYSPSRELTAMVYPLFEYSLLIYICLNFISTKLAFEKGQVKLWFWKLSQIFLPIMLFLTAQFRMIFVCIAYENVQQHTAGFLGLQVALILIAIENTLYVIASEKSYRFVGGGPERTKKLAMLYLFCLLIISSIKVSATTYLVVTGTGAEWTRKPTAIKGVVPGLLVDWIWMLFNAVLPVMISIIRQREEPSMTCLFYYEANEVKNAEDEEEEVGPSGPASPPDED